MNISFNVLLSIATLVVTLVGFYIWYLVFMLQAKTLNEQQELTKLSLLKYFYDIRPNFRLNYVFERYTSVSTPNENDEYHYTVTLEKNVAYDFRIENKTKFLSGAKFLKREISIIQVEESFDLIYDDFNRKYMSEEVSVYLYFKDEAGNKYYQFLHGNIGDLRLDPPLKYNIKE